jgi:hypothetical protein
MAQRSDRDEVAPVFDGPELQYVLLDFRRQDQQVHDLGDPRARHPPQPCQFRHGLYLAPVQHPLELVRKSQEAGHAGYLRRRTSKAMRTSPTFARALAKAPQDGVVVEHLQQLAWPTHPTARQALD